MHSRRLSYTIVGSGQDNPKLLLSKEKVHILPRSSQRFSSVTMMLALVKKDNEPASWRSWQSSSIFFYLLGCNPLPGLLPDKQQSHKPLPSRASKTLSYPYDRISVRDLPIPP